MSEFKAIDKKLSPALVKGGKVARHELARQLWENRHNQARLIFIKKLSAWTGYPIK
jgi:hypothetical protein